MISSLRLSGCRTLGGRSRAVLRGACGKRERPVTCELPGRCRTPRSTTSRSIITCAGCLSSSSSWYSLHSRSSIRFSSSSDTESNALSKDPPPGHEKRKRYLDHFGEPVTFLGCLPEDKMAHAMAALDGFLLAAVTKGRTCVLGGDEAGIEIRSQHSSAVAWSEALKFATFWNPKPSDEENWSWNTNNGDEKYADIKSAPMFAVVAVAPALAQTGVAYVKHLDFLLKQTKPIAPGLPSVQMMELAESAVKHTYDPLLNERERMHLKALGFLLKDQHRRALVQMLRILRICPGDAFALSLAMDLAQTCGDKEAASLAATSVVSYWHERRGGFLKAALPGYSIAMSLVSLGLAVGGNLVEAERYAEGAMKQGAKVCGGLATWAQAHVFDAGGRIAEGISALSNSDGRVNYEGCGFLFFDVLLAGYGARFSMDREERGRGKSAALRMYVQNFERVLDYSGFSSRQPWNQPQYKAPLSWAQTTMLAQGVPSDTRNPLSFLEYVTGKKKEVEKAQHEHFAIVMQQNENMPSRKLEGWDPSSEDVLTWLPPTPKVLSEATLCLFRLTLLGTVSVRNYRWDELRNAWEANMDLLNKYSTTDDKKNRGMPPLLYSPIVSLSAAILLPPSETGADQIGSGSMARGLHRMGQLLGLRAPPKTPEQEEAEKTKEVSTKVQYAIREKIAETDPDFWYPKTDGEEEEWKKIVRDLNSAIEGSDPEEYERENLDDEELEQLDSEDLDVARLRYTDWTFDARPMLEHAIVYAACKAGDLESLSIARAICSRGVTLRPMSPEEWWRYSIVLGLLGDEVASVDAWNRSVNVGSGQGGRRDVD